MAKVRLRVVSADVDLRRAEQDLAARQLEVDELREQLQAAEKSLKSAKERLDLLKRKKSAKKSKMSTKNPPFDPDAELGYNSRKFEKDPSKRLAKRSLTVARKAEKWDPLSLVGLYLEQYEKRFFREWRGSLLGLTQLHVEMKRLFQRVGDEASEAIEAVFSPRMKWVDGHVQLLLSVDGYERFVVPAIQKSREERKSFGEQSEWSGSTEAACEEVEW